MDFYLFLKNMGKNLINKYSQKLLDSAKKTTTDVIKEKGNSQNSRGKCWFNW